MSRAGRRNSNSSSGGGGGGNGGTNNNAAAARAAMIPAAAADAAGGDGDNIMSTTTMEGSLSKWTNVVNGWQYRWFVLDDNAGLLSYYTVSIRSWLCVCLFTLEPGA